MDFEDPRLDSVEESEIEAAVDVAVYGLDDVFRPIYIGQGKEILALTPEDAKRLSGFLIKAVQFVTDYQERSLQ